MKCRSSGSLLKLAHRERLWGMLGALFCSLVGALVLFTREPHSQGRPLRAWLDDYGQGLRIPNVGEGRGQAQARLEQASRALEAVREMGPSGVRALLRMMAAEDSELKLKLLSWARRQRIVPVSHRPSLEWRLLAAGMISDLGPSAEGAVDSLIAWLRDPVRRTEAGLALAGVGAAAVPRLTSLLTNEPRPLQESAVYLLGKIGSDASPATPTLLRLLEQTNCSVRGFVIRSLGEIGDPTGAVEFRLVELLQRPENALDAAYALAHLGPRGVSTVVRAVTNTNLRVRKAAVAALKYRVESRTDSDKATVRVGGGERAFNLRSWRAFHACATQRPAPAPESRDPFWVEQDQDFRSLALSSLSLSSPDAHLVLPVFRAVLRDSDPAVREAAREVLGQLAARPVQR